MLATTLLTVGGLVVVYYLLSRLFMATGHPCPPNAFGSDPQHPTICYSPGHAGMPFLVQLLNVLPLLPAIVVGHAAVYATRIPTGPGQGQSFWHIGAWAALLFAYAVLLVAVAPLLFVNFVKL